MGWFRSSLVAEVSLGGEGVIGRDITSDNLKATSPCSWVEGSWWLTVAKGNGRPEECVGEVHGVIFLNLFNSSTVDVQCCGDFCCTAKWFSCTHLHGMVSVPSSPPVMGRVICGE